MADIFAEEMTQETKATLNGEEEFVMFDSEEGKRASLSAITDYINETIGGTNVIEVVKVDGTALTPDQDKAVDIDLTGKVDVVDGKGLSTNDYTTAEKEKLAGIDMSTKVDKVDGKGLSTNDYTTSEKTKLEGIEAEANKTVVDSALSDSSTNPVQNKKVKEAVDELNERKADIDGYYEDLTSGSTDQILSNVYAFEDVPYLFRTTGGSVDVGNRKLEQLEGATICWNQLVQVSDVSATATTSYGITRTNNNDGTVTITGTNTSGEAKGLYLVSSSALNLSGHKYYIPSQIKDGVYVYNGETSNSIVTSVVGIVAAFIPASAMNLNITFAPQVFDLTAMFGSTIADYIYTLESTQAGKGVEFFKKLFPKPYYAYNAGWLMSVKAVNHVTTGFNQWDEEWEVGGINTTTGENQSDANRIRSRNYCPILPRETYYKKDGTLSVIYFYDTDKNYISYNSTQNGTFIVPNNAAYFKLRIGAGSSSPISTYNHDICINLHWDGERDGEYEPYVQHEYALDSDLELRGLFKLDANNKLYADGDLYDSDGTVTRKYGIVDLGTLEWNYNSTNKAFYTNLAGYMFSNSVKAFCSRYEYIGTTYSTGGLASDSYNKQCALYYLTGGSPREVYVKDLSYTDATTFKTAMSGVYLVYELAEPITETADPYTNPMIIDDFGTEWFEDTRDVQIPVGHNTKYVPNLKAKVEMAPNSPSGNGDYMVRQTSGINTYVPIEENATLQHKADINGYYEDLTSGNAEQLITAVAEEDKVPYNFRSSGGGISVGDRVEELVTGGSLVWNQLFENGDFHDNSEWEAAKGTLSISDNTANITATSVSTTNVELFEKAGSVVPKNVGHKYYISAKVKSTKNILYVDVSGLTFKRRNANTSANTWFAFGVVVSCENDSFVDLYVYSDQQEQGDVINIKDFMLFDLTAMFGSTIADYIYSLEQATSGAGVAWFKKLFPKPYYAYNAGELMSVKAGSHEMVGFNQWDEEWENGDYSELTGAKTTSSNKVRNKNLIKIIPNTTYFCHLSSSIMALNVYWYNNNKQFVFADIDNGLRRDAVFIVPDGCYYMAFSTFGSSYTTYNHDICINLSDPSRNGEYEPYVKRTYPLDNTLELRGIPKLDSNNQLYFDGDEYESDGTVTRRYGIVDLGELDWNYDSDGDSATSNVPYFYALVEGRKINNNFITSKYARKDGSNRSVCVDKGVSNYNDSSTIIVIMDSSYTDVATFKTAMSGQYLVYELATPTTEQADPFQSPQIVDDWGTEEYTDYAYEAGDRDVAIPVGHDSKYMANLRAKLETVPNSPSGNGDYVMRQTNGVNSYVPLVIPSELPTTPTTDGTYSLQVIVSSGTPTLSWVSAT